MGFRLCDEFSSADASGDHSQGIGMLLQILQPLVESELKSGRRYGSIESCPQDDDDICLLILIAGTMIDDHSFNEQE